LFDEEREMTEIISSDRFISSQCRKDAVNERQSILSSNLSDLVGQREKLRRKENGA
jgi:hypothetical protein